MMGLWGDDGSETTRLEMGRVVLESISCQVLFLVTALHFIKCITHMLIKHIME